MLFRSMTEVWSAISFLSSESAWIEISLTENWWAELDLSSNSLGSLFARSSIWTMNLELFTRARFSLGTSAKQLCFGTEWLITRRKVWLYLSNFACSLEVKSCFEVTKMSSAERSVISLALSWSSLSSFCLILLSRFFFLPWVFMCYWRMNSKNSPICSADGSLPSS